MNPVNLKKEKKIICALVIENNPCFGTGSWIGAFVYILCLPLC